MSKYWLIHAADFYQSAGRQENPQFALCSAGVLGQQGLWRECLWKVQIRVRGFANTLAAITNPSNMRKKGRPWATLYIIRAYGLGCKAQPC